MEKKKRRVLKSGIAVLLVIAIALTGTYAWQSISQEALNEVEGGSNPGGRLHDDFDGRNKDIYVENFSETESIFARIRLDEYMEIGPDAGKNKEASDRVVNSVIDGADINDKTTWTTHIPAQTDCNSIHKYWLWEMGGDTVFMPTFNKNKDSLTPDLNGTYQNKFEDYKEYDIGEKKTQDAVYDADDNHIDEGDAAIEGDNYSKQEETHTTKKTLTATVLTMDEWISQGAPAGPYWVYDTDGWAYWAEAIQPGESTGLLLDGIQLISSPEDKWYYAINVVAQFATAGDWGDEDKKTGFYKDGMTDDALLLLYRAAGVITIDNIDFYVLAIDKEDNKMLLWAKEQLSSEQVLGSLIWGNSRLRTYLNGTWLTECDMLSQLAVETTLTTRTSYSGTAFTESLDKVFLLSEADVFGTTQNGKTAESRDYTYNGERLPITMSMRKCTEKPVSMYWLRSPNNSSGSGWLSVVQASSGALASKNCTGEFWGVRPALWITLPKSERKLSQD